MEKDKNLTKYKVLHIKKLNCGKLCGKPYSIIFT